MTPLRFKIARMLHDEPMLQSLSVPQAELLDTVAGKRIALVGNARALEGGAAGSMIDAADLVVRINRAPMPSPKSHGTRTDMLALATSLPDADRARISAGRILWMSPKRKRLDRATAHTPGFYLHPLDDYETLKDRLGAPPTTGAMMIDLILKGGPAALDLYGFDFFASQSLSGRRRAEDVPHDFPSEADWVAALMRDNPHLHLHAMPSTSDPSSDTEA